MTNDVIAGAHILKPVKRFFQRVYRRHWRYYLWRALNPSRPYSDYYVDVVMRKIQSGRHHPAIGSEIVAGSTSTELLDFLLARGLKPTHCCVDYGCGSLRLGRFLIEFLEPGKYLGLDVTDQFYRMGASHLPEDLLAGKKPFLAVIDAASLAHARDAKPDFIASWHVLSKVPEQQLEDFFRKIIGMMGPNTKAFVHFPESNVRGKVSAMSWATPRQTLQATIKRIAPEAVVDFSLFKPGGRPDIQMSVVEISFVATAADRPAALAGEAARARAVAGGD